MGSKLRSFVFLMMAVLPAVLLLMPQIAVAQPTTPAYFPEEDIEWGPDGLHGVLVGSYPTAGSPVYHPEVPHYGIKTCEYSVNEGTINGPYWQTYKIGIYYANFESCTCTGDIGSISTACCECVLEDMTLQAAAQAQAMADAWCACTDAECRAFEVYAYKHNESPYHQEYYGCDTSQDFCAVTRCIMGMWVGDNASAGCVAYCGYWSVAPPEELGAILEHPGRYTPDQLTEAIVAHFAA